MCLFWFDLNVDSFKLNCVVMPERKGEEKRERWRGGMEGRWSECVQNRDGEEPGS